MNKLTERHHQIALLIATTPLEKQEIAKRVGLHSNTVSRTLTLPESQAPIAELRQQTQNQAVKGLVERMDEAAEEALTTLTNLVRGAKSEAVQFKAAESVLDCSTVAPEREIHSSRTVDVAEREIRITLTPELIAQLKPGVIPDDEDGNMIDVTPHPARPVHEAMAELAAAAGAASPSSFCQRARDPLSPHAMAGWLPRPHRPPVEWLPG